MLSYSDDNNIGSMGCKYLSRASCNSIKNLRIGKIKVMKTRIELEARECSTSPRHNGVRFGPSVYVNEC
jgi:hypothetical protein